MANTTIQLKKSSTALSSPGSLANGELAINYADGILYYKASNGSIASIYSQVPSFSIVNAAGTLILSDVVNDVLDIRSGDNIIITGDAINDRLTIAANLVPAFDYANTISTSGGGGGDKAYIFYQNTAPATSNAHDLWVNSNTGVVYENFGTSSTPIWAEFGPTTVTSGVPGVVATSNLNFTDGTYQITSAVGIGAASNTWSNTVGTAGNNYTVSVGAASNTWANTKLSNATGTLAGSLTVTGNTTVNGIAPNYAPNRPGFRVWGSGTTNNLTTTQNGTGCLTANNWTVDFNQGTYLANTNGVFTAPVAGLYQVNVIGRNSGYASGISQIGVTKNGSSGGTVGGTCILMIEFAASSTMNHAGGSTIINLAVGDTLACKILAGQINFDGNDNWSVAYIG